MKLKEYLKPNIALHRMDMENPIAASGEPYAEVEGGPGGGSESGSTGSTGESFAKKQTFNVWNTDW